MPDGHLFSMPRPVNPRHHGKGPRRRRASCARRGPFPGHVRALPTLLLAPSRPPPPRCHRRRPPPRSRRLRGRWRSPRRCSPRSCGLRVGTSARRAHRGPRPRSGPVGLPGEGRSRRRRAPPGRQRRTGPAQRKTHEGHGRGQCLERRAVPAVRDDERSLAESLVVRRRPYDLHVRWSIQVVRRHALPGRHHTPHRERREGRDDAVQEVALVLEFRAQRDQDERVRTGGQRPGTRPPRIVEPRPDVLDGRRQRAEEVEGGARQDERSRGDSRLIQHMLQRWEALLSACGVERGERLVPGVGDDLANVRSVPSRRRSWPGETLVRTAGRPQPGRC